MKGQIFILFSVLILVSLIMLEIGMVPMPIASTPQITTDFENIRNEIVKTVDFSILNEENISSNLDDLSLFLKEVYERRGYSLVTDYEVNDNGADVEVIFDINFKSEDSYVNDRITITRVVS